MDVTSRGLSLCVTSSSRLVTMVIITLAYQLSATLTGGSQVTSDLDHLPIIGPTEHCEFGAFQPSCGQGEVIVMRSARYGRMRLGQCVTADLGYVGCSADVLDLVDAMCSGRRSCTVQVPNQALAARSTCMHELKLYLEASYSCLKVMTMAPVGCQSQKCDHIRLTESSGYLASDVTRESGCGGVDCPWYIRVPPGQAVELTLYNFATRSKSAITSLSPTCRVVATVRDVSSQSGGAAAVAGRTSDVCAGAERISQVFRSASNVIELRIISRPQEYYVIHYQPVGCDEQQLPAGVRVRTVGDVTTLTCNYTGITWRGECHNGQWRASQQDSSVIRCEPPSTDHVRALTSVGVDQQMSLTYGLFTALIASIAIVVSALVIVAGVIAYRRRKSNFKDKGAMYYPSKMASSRSADSRDYALPIDPIPPPDYYAGQNVVPCPLTCCSPSRSGASSRRALQVGLNVQTGNSGRRTDETYTHIWQRPLPDPTRQQSYNYQQQQSMCSYTQPPSLSSALSHTYQGTQSQQSGYSSHRSEAYAELSPEDEGGSQLDERYFQLEPHARRHYNLKVHS